MSITITVNEDEVEINGFTLRDREIASYLGQYEADQMEGVLEQIIRIGTVGHKTVLVGNYMEMIRGEIQSGSQEIREDLISSFQEGNKQYLKPFEDVLDKYVKQEIDTYFRKARESHLEPFERKLKEFVSTDVENSFRKANETYIKPFKEVIDDAVSKILKEITKSEEQEKTTLKGKRFEDYVVDAVQGIAHNFGDGVEHIGVDNTTGDILISADGTSPSFCIEVKNVQQFDYQKLKRSYDSARRNRNVETVLFVFKNSEGLTRELKDFNVLGEKLIVTSLTDSDGETVSLFPLNYAYRVARTLSRASANGTRDVDIHALNDRTGSLKRLINRFSPLQSTVTKFTNEMQEKIRELRDAIEDEINGIESLLQRNEQS